MRTFILFPNIEYYPLGGDRRWLHAQFAKYPDAQIDEGGIHRRNGDLVQVDRDHDLDTDHKVHTKTNVKQNRVYNDGIDQLGNPCRAVVTQPQVPSVSQAT